MKKLQPKVYEEKEYINHPRSLYGDNYMATIELSGKITPSYRGVFKRQFMRINNFFLF